MSFYCPKFVAAIIRDKQKRNRYHKQYGIRYVGPGAWRTACRMFGASVAVVTALTVVGACVYLSPSSDSVFNFFERLFSAANGKEQARGNVGLDLERLRKELSPAPK